MHQLHTVTEKMLNKAQTAFWCRLYLRSFICAFQAHTYSNATSIPSVLEASVDTEVSGANSHSLH